MRMKRSGIFPAFILKGGHIFTYVEVLWKCIKINMVSMAAFYLCPQKIEWTMLKSKAERNLEVTSRLISRTKNYSDDTDCLSK